MNVQLWDIFYKTIDPRRRQEARDGNVISEDHAAMSNLPRMAQHHEWQKNPVYDSPYITDAKSPAPVDISIKRFDNNLDTKRKSRKR